MRDTFVRLSVTAILSAGLLAGCDWFDDPSPDEARVSVTGDDGDQVMIWVSKQFLTGITTEGVTQVELFDADTLIRTIPWDTTINIRSEQRFFVRTVDADSVSSRARMQVWIDEDREYDREGPVDVSQLLFLFTFNQPVTNAVEVL